MKNAVVVLLFLAATACMQKAADGTYRVVNPIAKKDAAAKARENASKSGAEIDKLGKKLEKGADKLAAKAGAGLEKAGKKLQEKSKPEPRR